MKSTTSTCIARSVFFPVSLIAVRTAVAAVAAVKALHPVLNTTKAHSMFHESSVHPHDAFFM